MGLMDKFKNLFTDEEIIEDDEEEKVEIKEIKQEEPTKLPTFMREKIEKEEQKVQPVKSEDEIEIKKEIKLEPMINSEEIKEENNNFKFPIDISENDFTETRTSRQEKYNQQEPIIPKKSSFVKERPMERPQKSDLKVAELYKDKKEPKEKDSKKFRATPIISPIYGVLDKNYNPDEVENRKGHNLEGTRPSKNVDFDSVRKKAYGNISKEIKENLMCENCEYLKEAKGCRNRNYEEDSYEELEEYQEPEDDYQDITMDEAAENYFDYGVEYEKPHQENNEEEDIRIVNHEDEDEEPRKNEIPPVKSSINLLSTLKKSMGNEEEEEEEPKKEKNLELTDDLFNLIDSMYDERNDEK